MTGCTGARTLRIVNKTPRTLYVDPPFATDFVESRLARPGESVVMTDGVTLSEFRGQEVMGVAGGIYVLSPGAPWSRQALRDAVAGAGFRYGFPLSLQGCAQGTPPQTRSGRLIIDASTDGNGAILTVRYDAYRNEALYAAFAGIFAAAALSAVVASMWIRRHPRRAGRALLPQRVLTKEEIVNGTA